MLLLEAKVSTSNWRQAILHVLVTLAALAWPFVAYGQTYQVIWSFTGPDGLGPTGHLVRGSDGNFYGTTSRGGAYGGGTIFRITPSGSLTTIFSFNPDDNGPGALLRGSDGNFYGTTPGGKIDHGRVYQLTSSGSLTTLHSFSGSDGSGPSFLVEGSDGNFYGTTGGGGADRNGTVFRMTPSGSLTTLHTFSGFDGSGPSSLVEGSDGNFYGTTSREAATDFGTVFKITPYGSMTTLHSFTGVDGKYPGAMVQVSNGNFYGTTGLGGPADSGTIFEITPTGALTTVFAFMSFYADGDNPSGSLLHGKDGDFYGTTGFGGPGQLGTIFGITPTGELTTLFGFSGGADGALPSGGLVESEDGSLYGTAFTDGLASLGGVIFRLSDIPGHSRPPISRANPTQKTHSVAARPVRP